MRPCLDHAGQEVVVLVWPEVELRSIGQGQGGEADDGRSGFS